MRDERLVDLVQRSLDGATSESEQLELSQRMAEDAAARSYAEEMAAVAGLLNRATAAALPIDFTASVMRDVRSHAASSDVAAAGNVHPFEKKRKVALRIAVGIAAAVALVMVIAPPSFVAPDAEGLRGTMVAPVTSQRSTVSAGPHSSIEVIASRDEVVLWFHVASGASGARGAAHVTFDHRVLRSAAPAPSSAPPGTLQVDLDATPTLVRFQRLRGDRVTLRVETRFPEQPPFRTTIEIPSTGDESPPFNQLSAPNAVVHNINPV